MRLALLAGSAAMAATLGLAACGDDNSAELGAADNDGDRMSETDAAYTTGDTFAETEYEDAFGADDAPDAADRDAQTRADAGESDAGRSAMANADSNAAVDVPPEDPQTQVALRQNFQAIDQDGDSRISQAEWAEWQGWEERTPPAFDDVDADNSDAVAFAEFDEAYARTGDDRYARNW